MWPFRGENQCVISFLQAAPPSIMQQLKNPCTIVHTIRSLYQASEASGIHVSWQYAHGTAVKQKTIERKRLPITVFIHI